MPNRRTKRVPVKPEALLAGLDGDALLEEVLTHPLGRFVCEVDGAVRLSSPLRALVRDGKADPAPVSETPARALRTVNLETAVVHSRLAVMDWHTFLRTVDARRHPAKKWLEMLLGRRLSGHRPDVVDITPDRIGELPGLVAGLHRDDPDRLCAVRVVYRDRFTRRLDKNRTPVVIKTRELPGGRLHRQRFHHVVPVMLAVFPAGWLAPVTEPWMPGLFGTPLDPTLLEFCGTMPEAWRQELAAVIPPEDPVRPMLDVRKLV